MKPAGRVGDIAFCPSDSHGCPGCAHPVQGPAIQGSPNVLINDLPALRVGDPGIHAACCGGNKWKAKEGAAYVWINDKSEFREGDPSAHCGGNGQLVSGSPSVIVGDLGGKSFQRTSSWIEIELLDERGQPIPNIPFQLSSEDGAVVLEGMLDSRGLRRIEGIDGEKYHVSFPTKSGRKVEKR